MSLYSSIHFKKSIGKFQVAHNYNIRPNYAVGGEIECNHTARTALAIRAKMVKLAQEAYKASTNQPFKAKSYDWSAVCNLKPDSTMQDLERLAKHFEDKYGFQCYQIAIHRDEGHINDDGEKVINHHAHLEFITLDKKTGRNRYKRSCMGYSVMRQIQTEVAEILGMERGVDNRISKIKRVEPRKYGQMKEAERKNLKKIKQENTTIINQKNDQIENLEKYSDEGWRIVQEAASAVERIAKEMEHEIKSESFKGASDEIVSALKMQKIMTLREQKEILEAERKKWIEEGDHKAEEYKQLRALAEKGKKYDELLRQIAELNEIHRQRVEKEFLESQKTPLEILNSILNNFKNKNDELEESRQRLEEELEKQRESNNSLKSEILKLNTNSLKTNQELYEYQKLIQDLISENENLKELYRELENRFQELDEEGERTGVGAGHRRKR